MSMISTFIQYALLFTNTFRFVELILEYMPLILMMRTERELKSCPPNTIERS